MSDSVERPNVLSRLKRHASDRQDKIGGPCVRRRKGRTSLRRRRGNERKERSGSFGNTLAIYSTRGPSQRDPPLAQHPFPSLSSSGSHFFPAALSGPLKPGPISLLAIHPPLHPSSTPITPPAHLLPAARLPRLLRSHAAVSFLFPSPALKRLLLIRQTCYRRTFPLVSHSE